jgi:hypothetical protein
MAVADVPQQWRGTAGAGMAAAHAVIELDMDRGVAVWRDLDMGWIYGQGGLNLE